MWTMVARAIWPAWASQLNHVWKHKHGHWLTGQTNKGSTLWELRTPHGAVYCNQLDLPFAEGMSAPLDWATHELLEEMPSRANS